MKSVVYFFYFCNSVGFWVDNRKPCIERNQQYEEKNCHSFKQSFSELYDLNFLKIQMAPNFFYSKLTIESTNPIVHLCSGVHRPPLKEL